jgi:hypothetical protein
MPSSIDALEWFFSYKSYTLIYNEIPHFINAYQKFPPSDILPHSLLHLLILALRTLFPIMYLSLCHMLHCVWLNILFHQFLYNFTGLGFNRTILFLILSPPQFISIFLFSHIHFPFSLHIIVHDRLLLLLEYNNLLFPLLFYNLIICLHIFTNFQHILNLAPKDMSFSFD